MSILSNREIVCECGETFETNLWSAVSVSDNPELKEAIIAGEFNLVSCPKCHQMFYWEHFFIYQDLANEFIAYVYPKSYQKQAAHYRNLMIKQFKEVASSTTEVLIDFEPVLYFGIEDLVATLKMEENINDEIQILKFVSKLLDLNTISIKPSAARNFCIMQTIPFVKNEKDKTKAIIFGLEKLLEYNNNLVEFEKLLARIKSNPSCLNEILLHKISN